MKSAVVTTPFSVIKHAVSKQFESMKTTQLYRVDLSGPQGALMSPEQRKAFTGDKLWETYIAAFPEGTNPVYKERTDHDCQCCKAFIRQMGGVVAIVDGRMRSIWTGYATSTFYDYVASAMEKLVLEAPIDNIFLHTEKQVGTDKSFTQMVDGPFKNTLTWEHFHVHLPNSAVLAKANIGPKLSDTQAAHDVLKRGLEELTLDAVNTVLELVAQNSLYRGMESKAALLEFRRLKMEYDHFDNPEFPGYEAARAQHGFVWSNIGSFAARIRNTAIGTLLIDLSGIPYFDGATHQNSRGPMDLEDAVKKFESSVMAPANYKRPTALVSKAMIAKAQATIEELGYTSALERRYATIDDITINNVLFADRSAKLQGRGNVFADLAAKIPEKMQNYNEVEEVSIDTFVDKILPTVKTIEVLLENRHAGNLVSLVAPVDPGAKSMFKWPNNFSWSYAGNVADSMKERVAAAGGRVDGVLRFTHSWNHPEAGRNGSLMDLHLFMPGSSAHADGCHDRYPSGPRVGWNRRNDPASGGIQDVDYTAVAPENYIPIENIALPSMARLKDGVYTLKIHNWNARSPNLSGFRAEVEFDGQLFQYDHPKPLRNKEWITLAELTLKNGKFTIVHHHTTETSSRQMWGVETQTFRKVNVVTLSPNYWDGGNTPHGEVAMQAYGHGNKHYFFMLDGCVNAEQARGFYNEFFSSELEPHRKTMEMVGAKMLTDNSDRQLSGLGFSSTQRNSLTMRLTGSFSRVVKVMF